jgi:Transposase
MEQFIGCDAHKKFSLFVTMNEKGEYGRAIRVGHEREVFREFLKDLPAGSQIALETSGSYYWLVDEMERAGHDPQLAHALTAKRRMEGRYKTDERDARGLAMLLRNGTLPRGGELSLSFFIRSNTVHSIPNDAHQAHRSACARDTCPDRAGCPTGMLVHVLRCRRSPCFSLLNIRCYRTACQALHNQPTKPGATTPPHPCVIIIQSSE